MSKLNKILIILIIVLLVVLGVVVYWQKVGFKESYWAVYLGTGDLYFGKLDRFPSMSLTDVWFLQKNAEDTKNPVSLAKFDGIFWGPESRIYLNEKSIIWKVKLKADSSVLKYIENPQSEQAQNQQSVQPSTQETATLQKSNLDKQKS